MQQLKEINRNEIVEHKKRVEKRKKAIESDVKEVMFQEETVKESDTIKKKTVKENDTIKKKTVKKSVADKKVIRDKQKAISEEAMGNAQKKKINIEKSSHEEGSEEPKVVITKEERAERFKKLNAIAQEMTKKWNK